MNEQTYTPAQIRTLLAAGVNLEEFFALGDEQAQAPTPVVEAQPKAEEPSEFVTWLRETAEQRQARKASNREMAAWLREKNLPTNGDVWEAAKAGERNVRKLRSLAKAQASA